MLIKWLLDLCWIILVLCILIFGDIIRVNVLGRSKVNSKTMGCGVINSLPTTIGKEKETEYLLGKTLFKNYCASCHNKNMRDDMTGPALIGVEERWVEYPREDLYNWIRNSKKMVDEKHPRATKLYLKWKTDMTAFPNFSDEEIESLLLYVKSF